MDFAGLLNMPPATLPIVASLALILLSYHYTNSDI